VAALFAAPPCAWCVTVRCLLFVAAGQQTVRCSLFAGTNTANTNTHRRNPPSWVPPPPAPAAPAHKMSGWLATVKNWATMPPTPLPVSGVEPPAGSSMFAWLAGLFNFTTTTEGDNLKVKCRDLFRMDTGKLCEAETVAVRSGKVATSHAVTHLRNVHQYALPF